MTVELHWLTLTVLMTALFWVPIFLDRVVVRGLWPAIQGTTPEVNLPHSIWAQRAMRAHANAIENLAVFVPLVLVANLLHVSNEVTRMAVVVYFFARLLHFVVYTVGVPLGRTPMFTVGWAAQMALVGAILGWF